MHALNAALKIGGSLMDSDAQQKKQDAEYDQLRWRIEGSNVATLGKRKADEDYYKQVGRKALNTATRAYYLEDVKLDQEIGRANEAAQINLVKLIKGSGKGSAKGQGGTADRVNLQAIKNWGRRMHRYVTEYVRKL